MTISLGQFDEKLFLSIEGHEEVRYVDKGVYHTILIDGQKAGVVGYIPMQNSKGENQYFVQIIISSEDRGKGLTKLAEDLLAKTYHLSHLFATIDTNNIASLKAHQKAGFCEIDREIIASLREKGFLKVGQTRLIKIYA